MWFQSTSSDGDNKTKSETTHKENDSSITQLDPDSTVLKQEVEDESALYDNFPQEEEEVDAEDSGIPEPEDSEEEWVLVFLLLVSCIEQKKRLIKKIKLARKKRDFLCIISLLVVLTFKNKCCTSQSWSDKGVAIDIPCYFGQKSNLLILFWNNMGFQWQLLNLTKIV